MKSFFVLLTSLQLVHGCETIDRIVNCSYEKLKSVPRPDVLSQINITDLVQLDLSKNRIASPVDFTDWAFAEIFFLDLSYNNLTYVKSDFFTPLKHLKVLNISHNSLEWISIQWSSLPYVEHLDISSNWNLRDSINIFSDLSNSSVKILNVSLTRAMLPSYDIFKKAQSLLSLDLSNNELNIIPKLPSNLEQLYFDNNTISSIVPDYFDEASKLKTLSLENNSHLNYIKFKSFDSLTELEYLSFRGCSSLNHLPISLFSANDKLNFLSLADCALTNISVAFKTAFLSIHTIELEGNPWYCSVHIKWFVQLHDRQIVSDKIRCSSPENVSLTEYLGPKVKHKAVRIALSIISVVLFTVMIVVVSYSCRLENRRRKTLNSYRQLETPSKAYRGSMIYVTSSV